MIIKKFIIIGVSEVADALWKMFTSFVFIIIFLFENIEDCMKSVKYVYPGTCHMFWGKMEW